MGVVSGQVSINPSPTALPPIQGLHGSQGTLELVLVQGGWTLE